MSSTTDQIFLHLLIQWRKFCKDICTGQPDPDYLSLRFFFQVDKNKSIFVYLYIHLFTVYFCICGSQRTTLTNWLFPSTAFGPRNPPQVTVLSGIFLTSPIFTFLNSWKELQALCELVVFNVKRWELQSIKWSSFLGDNILGVLLK